MKGFEKPIERCPVWFPLRTRGSDWTDATAPCRSPFGNTSAFPLGYGFAASFPRLFTRMAVNHFFFRLTTCATDTTASCTSPSAPLGRVFFHRRPRPWSAPSKGSSPLFRTGFVALERPTSLPNRPRGSTSTVRPCQPHGDVGAP